VAAIARGDFVVVMDDESRENEGDLIIPAVGCSTEQMAWMIKHTRYVPLPPDSALTGPDLNLGVPHPMFTQRVHLHLSTR
jgi:3,4-dihydroxy-2-butanone 4-phosphate synthase